MKNRIVISGALIAFSLSMNGEGKMEKLSNEFYEKIEIIKMDYRSKLVDLLKDSTKIEVLQLNLEKSKKYNGNPFGPSDERYYRIGEFEFEIEQKKTFESEEMVPWRSALQELLAEAYGGSYLSFHSYDTVIIVYAKDAISALEESALFAITLSWKNNNYLLTYPRLGKEKHLIAGKEIKALMQTAFPSGNFDADPTLRAFATESKQSGDGNSE